MKLLIDIPEEVVTAIQNGKDYRYDIHTTIAQGIPYESKGDLISREALRKAFHKRIYYFDKSSWDEANAIIDSAPTVNPLTDNILEAYLKIMDSEFEHHNEFWIITPKGKKIYFEKKRPKGEWIDTDEMAEHWGEEYQCSICGGRDYWHNFCHNCGADMRKGG